MRDAAACSHALVVSGFVLSAQLVQLSIEQSIAKWREVLDDAAFTEPKPHLLT